MLDIFGLRGLSVYPPPPSPNYLVSCLVDYFFLFVRVWEEGGFVVLYLLSHS